MKDFPTLNLSDSSTRTLADEIGAHNLARSSPDEFLARALSRYDDPDWAFLSGEFANRFWGETICIHGSGPSIEETLPELLRLVADGAKVCAVNAAYRWLRDKGINPHFAIMADPKPFVADYQDPNPGTLFLINSGCHDDVFEKFRRCRSMLVWHALNAYDGETVLAQATKIMGRGRATGRGAYVVEGGSTTTMRALDVFRFFGFQHLHFFGVDSSGRRNGTETVMHGHPKPHVVKSQMRPVYVRDPKACRDLAHEFWSNGPMEFQALHWEIILRRRFEQMREGMIPPAEVVVHGEGLWPALAAMYGLHADPIYAERLRAEGYRPEPEPPILASLGVAASFPTITLEPPI